MKKVFFLSLICFVSCVEIEDNQERYESDAVKNSVLLDNIMSYIAATHEPATRGGDSYYNIYPYLYEGDTVMYVANYDDGWQIFSNSEIAPMVLASSETGHLDLEDETFQESPMYAYIQGLAEEVRYAQAYTTGSGDLGTLVSLPVDSFFVGPIIISRVDTISIEERNHLIMTKWGNKEPWNSYTPYYRGQHSQVGCGAVAVAQYLYYQHGLTRVPATAMSRATYTHSTQRYTFSNPSTTIWNKMALTRTGENTDSAAVYLGFISDAVCHNYTDTATYSNDTDRLSYLSSLGFNFERVTMDFSYIVSQLNQQEPILLDIYTGTGGHSLIIDSYRIERLSMLYWSEVANRFLRKTITNQYIRMNWGWDGVCDDVLYIASNAEDWIVNYRNATGNFTNQFTIPAGTDSRKMYKRTSNI